VHAFESVIDALVQPIEPVFHPVEPTLQTIEPPLQTLEPTFQSIESALEALEPPPLTIETSGEERYVGANWGDRLVEIGFRDVLVPGRQVGHERLGMFGAENLLKASIQRSKLRIWCGHQGSWSDCRQDEDWG
jgi:hypothetical protein